MEYDNEDDTTSNLVMELEEATEMVDEVPNHTVAINIEEAINYQLLKLPPRVSVSRTGIASTCMDQMIHLKKMDRKRLQMIMIATPTNVNITMHYFLSPGKLMGK